MSENKPYFQVLHPPTFNECQVIPSFKDLIESLPVAPL